MPEDKKPPQTKGKAGEIAKLLRDANNVLVITSRDPSVDQLSASIGLALALNKSGKHVSAVYSGTTPSIIDFLEPGKTLDKNTDSLRDFIISLDRSKADKLRYKVEDEIVRIFITPYKASISDKDLDFSQGDFNIDLIIALGVHDNGDLDNAITAHGRILHDAKIINITNADQPNEFGTDHWNEQKASSLSEMTTNLVELVSKDILDNQSATAFLTGVVYETDRFKNEKATPETMETAGVLMGAGASTQLVADKLEEDKPEPEPETPDEPEENQELPESEDSSSQEPNEPSADEGQQSDPDDVEEEVTEIPDIEEKPEEEPKKQEPDVLKIDHDDQIHIDDAGKLHIIAEEEKAIADQKEREEKERERAEAIKQNEQAEPLPTPLDQPTGDSVVDQPVDPVPSPKSGTSSAQSLITDPPKFSSKLTANSEDTSSDYTSQPDVLAGQKESTDTLSQTLTDLEKSIDSSHVKDDAQQRPVSGYPSTRGKTIQPLGFDGQTEGDKSQIDYAQEAVDRAVNSSMDYRPEPIQALGSQPMGQPNLNMPPLNGNNQAPPMPNSPQLDTGVSDSPSGTPPPPVPPPFNP